MGATAIDRATHIFGARVSIVAIDAFAKSDALSVHALTWVTIEAAGRAVCQRRIGTTAIDWVTHILGAVVVVVAVDAFAKVGFTTVHQQDQPEREQR